MAVIIVGGGMAGATLALALSHLTKGSLAIDLVETKLPDSDHPGFDSRAIALAIGTCQKLDKIGVWPTLSDYSEAIRSIYVSDKSYGGRVSLSADEHRLPAFGYVIELYEAGRKLFSLLNQHANINVHCPAKMVAVKQTQRQIEIELDNGEVLSGQLAVAADGSYSPLASSLGITWQESDYQQIAVIANLVMSEPQAGVAFERFTSHGPLALLPMTKNGYSLVWCHELSRKDDVMNWQENQFIDELQREFGWRLGRIKKVGRRSCYPLVLRRADRTTSHRLALVGNAAQTLHPIAGQGFNLGLRDVISLAETISEAWTNRQDLGDYNTLSRYRQARETDRALTIGLTDRLLHLFANDSRILGNVRNLAMAMTDNSLTVKNKLIQPMLGQFKR